MIELTVNDGPRAGADVLRALDAAQIPIAGLALREPSLDDVFLSLTGHKTDDRRRGGEETAKPRRGLGRAPQGRRDRREGCRMTTTTVTAPVRLSRAESGQPPVVGRGRTSLTITWRNLLALTRTPEALFFSTLQPIMFVLLFTYVFGGAIHVPGGHYVDYLMPGIFVQTVIFGAMSTAVGLAEDLHKGLIERFRALPMSRSAVLAGRTTADLVRNVFVVIADHGRRLRRRLPHRDQRRAVPLRGAADPVLRLRAELGLRLSSACPRPTRRRPRSWSSRSSSRSSSPRRPSSPSPPCRAGCRPSPSTNR